MWTHNPSARAARPARDRPADVEEGEPGQILVPGKLHGLDLGPRQPAGRDLLHIFGRVDEEEVLVLGGLRAEKILGPRAVGQEPLVDHPVFPDRKDVASDVDEPVLVAVDELEGEPAAQEKTDQSHGWSRSISRAMSKIEM